MKITTNIAVMTKLMPSVLMGSKEPMMPPKVAEAPQYSLTFIQHGKSVE
ncbi:hypothetical protein [Dorea formicigenerans]|nr:hypothetical protein [Dorea formicigenerans]